MGFFRVAGDGAQYKLSGHSEEDEQSSTGSNTMIIDVIDDDDTKFPSEMTVSEWSKWWEQTKSKQYPDVVIYLVNIDVSMRADQIE